MILLFLIQSVIGGPYGDDRLVQISVEFSRGCLWRTLESPLLFVNYFDSKEYFFDSINTAWSSFAPKFQTYNIKNSFKGWAVFLYLPLV